MTPSQQQAPRRGRPFSFWRMILTLAFLAFILKGLIPAYYVHRGFEENHAHHLDAAIADERTALRWNPRSAAAHNNLGFYLFEEGKYDQALPEIREALRISPHNAHLHDSLGQLLSHTGHPDEAVQECQEAIRLEPTDAVCYNTWATRSTSREKRPRRGSSGSGRWGWVTPMPPRTPSGCWRSTPNERWCRSPRS